MAGFENSVMVAKNVNFDEIGAKPHNGIINAAGKLMIGTGNSSPTPEILGGSITSTTLNVGYSSPNITIEAGTTLPTTFIGDNGTTAIPASNNITIYANNAANDNGSTVKFVNSGAISELKFTDALNNIIIGKNAGNFTLTGTDNVVIGVNTADSFTIAANNVAIGYAAMENAEAASDCVAIGFGALRNAINLNVNSTVAIGTQSCTNMDIGNDNTCVGYHSLRDAVSGGTNTAIGYGTLTLCDGSNNTAIGAGSGALYTGTESFNTLLDSTGVLGDNSTIRIGPRSGLGKCYIGRISSATVSGSAPIGIDSNQQLSSLGYGSATQVLTSNGAATSPTWQAVSASGAITTVTGNTGGAESPSGGNFNFLTANTTVKFAGTAATETLDFGLSNLVLGGNASAITIGTNNVGLGNGLFNSLTNGTSNTFVGNNTSGSPSIVDGDQNCGFGQNSLVSLSSGDRNSAFGYLSGNLLTTGTDNIFLGNVAGEGYTSSESSNIAIGNLGTVGESNTIRIGTAGSGTGQQNKAFLAGVTAVTVASSAPVAVDTNGQLSSLGTGSSGQVLTSTGTTSPTWQAVSASGAITQITGSSGGAQTPSAGNFNILGSGSITTAGTANTETVQLTGLTNHSVLVGAGTATITKVAPSATSGVPLISQGASSDPVFGVALVAGGGTGVASTTAYGLIAGGTTTTGAFQNTGAGTSGQYLKSNGSAALPSFAALPSQATITSVAVNSTIANVTGDGTFYFPIIFDTEFVDAGNRYSTVTGNFTAPTTGNYLINANITFTGLTTLHTAGEISIIIAGSTFTRYQFNPGAVLVSGNASFSISLVAALTATNTVSIGALISGSTKTVGIQGNSGGYESTASFVFLG